MRRESVRVEGGIFVSAGNVAFTNERQRHASAVGQSLDQPSTDRLDITAA